MGGVLYFIIFFLAFGLTVFELLYWLGKLFIYLLPKKLKENQTFIIQMFVLFVLIGNILCFSILNFKKSEKKEPNSNLQITRWNAIYRV